ncbi:hypothetical protein D3C75_1316930 [compost metagenome]
MPSRTEALPEGLVVVARGAGLIPISLAIFLFQTNTSSAPAFMLALSNSTSGLVIQPVIEQPSRASRSVISRVASPR